MDHFFEDFRQEFYRVAPQPHQNRDSRTQYSMSAKKPQIDTDRLAGDLKQMFRIIV